MLGTGSKINRFQPVSKHRIELKEDDLAFTTLILEH